MKYTVILEPQEEGGYTIQCVELPGAISQGETKEEALMNIKAAIALILEVLREEVHKKTPLLHSEIITVDIADAA